MNDQTVAEMRGQADVLTFEGSLLDGVMVIREASIYYREENSPAAQTVLLENY